MRRVSIFNRTTLIHFYSTFVSARYSSSVVASAASSSSSSVVNLSSAAFDGRELLNNHLTQLEKQFEAVRTSSNNQRSNNDREDDESGFKSLIQEWMDTGVFRDPDMDALGSDPLLLCRWLVLSANLYIGEDAVDAVCVSLSKLEDSADFINNRVPLELLVKTFEAFELWNIRESPACLGLIPLFRALELRLAQCSEGVESTVRDDAETKTSAGDSQVVLRLKTATLSAMESVFATFRKRHKSEFHAVAPQRLDEAMASFVRCYAQFVATNSPYHDELSTADWIDAAHSWLKLGARRFPLTLHAILSNLNLGACGVSLTSSSESDSIMATVGDFQGVMLQRLQSDPSFTRRILEGLERFCGLNDSSVSLERRRIDVVRKSLVGGAVYYPMLLSQLHSWPLRDVGLVTSLCLVCLQFQEQQQDQQQQLQQEQEQAHENQQEAVEIAAVRALLVLSIRTSYFGLLDVVSFHPTMGNVEIAICANKFLNQLQHSVPGDLADRASLGLPTALDVPAQKILSRFPHLKR